VSLDQCLPMMRYQGLLEGPLRGRCQRRSQMEGQQLVRGIGPRRARTPLERSVHRWREGRRRGTTSDTSETEKRASGRNGRCSFDAGNQSEPHSSRTRSTDTRSPFLSRLRANRIGLARVMRKRPPVVGSETSRKWGVRAAVSGARLSSVVGKTLLLRQHRSQGGISRLVHFFQRTQIFRNDATTPCGFIADGQVTI
jgi:hypothetical protein